MGNVMNQANKLVLLKDISLDTLMYKYARSGKRANNKQIIKYLLKDHFKMDDSQISSIIENLEFDYISGGSNDANAIDDEPITIVNLVYVVNKTPPVPPKIVEEIPESKPLVPDKTMLKIYYGDKKAEKDRSERFKRYKSHIVKTPRKIYDKDSDSFKEVEVYTVEEYEGKAADTQALMIEGFSTRLERLSKANLGDFSEYETKLTQLIDQAKAEIYERYRQLQEENPTEAKEFYSTVLEELNAMSDDNARRAVIQAMIDEDTEFLETNNYTYNRRQNTSENLKTLGKLGEKSIKQAISKNDSKASKFWKHGLNALITIRNYTKAPVNKTIGTFIASPIYSKVLGVTRSTSKQPNFVNGYAVKSVEDVILESQKNSKGLFAGSAFHRYEARKDYFANLGREEIIKKREKEIALVRASKIKEVLSGLYEFKDLIKLAFVPRLKSIFNYKEGNIAVCNAGLEELASQAKQRNTEITVRFLKIKSADKKIAICEKDLEALSLLEKVVKDPFKIEEIKKLLKLTQDRKKYFEYTRDEVERSEVDSVSRDAISLSQHDKANKAKMTQVITGIKFAGRLGVGQLLSKYLWKIIPEKTTQVKTGEKTTEVGAYDLSHIVGSREQINSAKLENGSWGDFIKVGEQTGQYASFPQGGGNAVSANIDNLRGISFMYNGKQFSASDAIGFNYHGRTATTLSPMSFETNPITTFKEVIKSSTGKDLSTEEIINEIASGNISGVQLWGSTSPTGIPTMWLPELDLQKAIMEKVPIFEIEHIPGQIITEDIIETITEPPRRVLNVPIVALETLFAEQGVSDLNDLLRWTRSAPSMMKSTVILALFKKAKESSQQGPEENLSARTIKSCQRNNKEKPGKRKFFWNSACKKMQNHSKRYFEEHPEEAVSVFDRFLGTRQDLTNDNGYDENAYGINATTRRVPLKDAQRRSK